MRKSSATIAAFLGFVTSSLAEFSVWTSEIRDTNRTSFDVSRFIDTFTLRASQTYGVEIDNSDAEFDFSEISLTTFVTKPISLGGDWSFISYLDFSASRFDFDDNPLVENFSSDLESDLFRVGLPFAVYHASSDSRWTYGAWVSPAISSDFDDIGSDDFFLDAALMTAYQMTECFVLGAGIYASDILDDPFVIPGIGFVWTPTDDWLVSYYGPRFVARYDINQANQIGWEVATNGGNWNIDANDESLKVNFRSWRTGLYYRYNLTGEVWLQAAAGMTFANKYELQDRGGDELFSNELGEAEAAPYAFLGLSVARW